MIFSKVLSISSEEEFCRINLTDDKDTIINKIKKATTDTMPMPDENEDLVLV